MKAEEIKNECELMYAQIKTAQNRLKELRAICIHEDTFEGNYSHRIGAVCLATICYTCGHVVKSDIDFNF